MKRLLHTFFFGAKPHAREQKLPSRQVSSRRSFGVVGLIYNEINMALWAIGVTSALYVVAVILPKLPELRSRAEVLRIQEINAANEHYCQKLHIGPGMPMHDECILALDQLRNDVEKRMADDNEF